MGIPTAPLDLPLSDFDMSKVKVKAKQILKAYAL